MRAIRHVIDAVAPTDECQIVSGQAKSFVGDEPIGLLNCHGSGDNAFDALQEPNARRLLENISQHTTTLTGDFGYQTWGNDVFVNRAEQARVHLENVYGVEGKLIIVAVSMGFLNACNYARVYPERVAAIAGIIPGCDLTDLYNRGAQVDIDAAYGGYNPAVDGPIHNPVEFAGDLDPDMPIHIWNAPDDFLTVPATVTAFMNARPQTGRTFLPPYGHSVISVGNAVAGVNEKIREWTKTLY